MRSLLEGSRKARESCRAILTFDRQKGGPKMSQNVIGCCCLMPMSPMIKENFVVVYFSYE